MTNNDAVILFPNRELKIGNETVTVSELKWADALGFLKQLSGHMAAFVTADGKLKIDVAELGKVVASSEDLAVSLIAKATGHDADWVNNLPLSVVLDLVDVALELNLSDDLLAKAKKIGGRFKAAAPPGQPLARPTITSSIRDTAAPNSTKAP